jgi:ribosomal protein S18 acetylase RimI-like enzyme
MIDQRFRFPMIRLAQPSDVPEVAAVHVRAWQVAYRGHLPDSYLSALDPVQRAVRWSRVVVDPEVTMFVAVDSPSVVGFCSLMSSRDGDAPRSTGEIATLYVDPRHWRRGVGRALVDSVVIAALERGFQAMSLWVLATNAPARAFYESLGFSPDGQSKVDFRVGPPLHEVRYQRNVSGSR